MYVGGAQWSRSVRCGSAAARLLGLRVRILPGVWCFQVEMSATNLSFVQRGPAECGVSECDLGTSNIRRSRPTSVVEPWKKLDVRVSVHH